MNTNRLEQYGPDLIYVAIQGIGDCVTSEALMYHIGRHPEYKGGINKKHPGTTSTNVVDKINQDLHKQNGILDWFFVKRVSENEELINYLVKTVQINNHGSADGILMFEKKTAEAVIAYFYPNEHKKKFSSMTGLETSQEFTATTAKRIKPEKTSLFSNLKLVEDLKSPPEILETAAILSSIEESISKNDLVVCLPEIEVKKVRSTRSSKYTTVQAACIVYSAMIAEISEQQMRKICKENVFSSYKPEGCKNIQINKLQFLSWIKKQCKGAK